jgi:hypothetical protein
MKTDPKLKSTAVLHYVDIPDGMRFEDMDQDAKKLTVVSAIQSLKSFLKTKNENDLVQVPPLAGISRPEALKFLIHFIGDLHQPLHVGGKSDRGGNDFKVLFLSQERPSNLHSVWDSLLIESQELSFMEYADLLERRNHKGHAVSSVLTFDISAWANEGVAVRDQIYNLTKDGKTQIPQVNYDYILKNRDLLESRLMLAGHRLAQILNDIFSK